MHNAMAWQAYSPRIDGQGLEVREKRDAKS